MLTVAFRPYVPVSFARHPHRLLHRPKLRHRFFEFGAVTGDIAPSKKMAMNVHVMVPPRKTAAQKEREDNDTDEITDQLDTLRQFGSAMANVLLRSDQSMRLMSEDTMKDLYDSVKALDHYRDLKEAERIVEDVVASGAV